MIFFSERFRGSGLRFSSAAEGRSRQIPVAMARGKHLFPFRTEQLSPSAPMVLGPQGPGRVGRCRIFADVRTPLPVCSGSRVGSAGTLEREELAHARPQRLATYSVPVGPTVTRSARLESPREAA